MSGDTKYVYQQNIERAKIFNNSLFIKDLYFDGYDIRKDYFFNIYKTIFEDPDEVDDILYSELSEWYGVTRHENKSYVTDNEIVLKADAIFGWKQLYKYHAKKVKKEPGMTYYEKYESIQEDFLEDYKFFRGNKAFHLLFPSQRPSINMLRYEFYHDRIDYLLYELKNYYVKPSKCKLVDAYRNNTKMWLDGFEEENREASFRKLVNFLKLEDFIVIENGEIKIVNLSKKQFDEDDDNEDNYINDSDLEVVPSADLNEIYIENIRNFLKKKNKSQLII